MKKIISMSLYGPHALYNAGAYENIAERDEYFPDWQIRFYCDKTSPILPVLLNEQRNGHCEVVIENKPTGNYGMFWRLCAISDPDASHIIIRDTDQRLNDKDAQAVNHWIQTGMLAHRMAETESQAKFPLLGCAWGIQGGVIADISKMMANWFERYKGYEIGERKFGIGGNTIKQVGGDEVKLFYGSDQVFLHEVWNIIKDSCITYGVNGHDFPTHKPLKWGGTNMFERICPSTACKQIFGDRPQYAYQTEAE